MLLSRPMALTDEKQEFSKRLRDTLKRSQGSERGAASIAREFNLRYEGTPVTAPAVRKWLDGKALPSQDKVRALARWLDVSPHWLRFGEGESGGSVKAAPGARQNVAAYRVEPQWLAKKYEALNEPHKKIIVEVLIALLRLEGKR
jgi:transcriptional regulator with XRE-family HTH domain